MFCRNCGAQIGDQARFCEHCGASIVPAQAPSTAPCCPHCGSHLIDTQVHQENKGGTTVTKTKSVYKEKRHGCLWWLFIGSWWWMVDIMLWILFFPFRLIAQLCKKKKYHGKTKSVSTTANHIKYRTVYLCKSCGHHWEK